MPYYLFKLQPNNTPEVITHFSNYREARNQAYVLREALQSTDNHLIKIIFAPSENAAEELLAAKREAPILREDEK